MRVKLGKFGQSGKFGQRPCLFHISNIGIKKINLANSENPDETAHQEPSHLDLHCLQMCVRIYLISEFTGLYPLLALYIYTNAAILILTITRSRILTSI